MEQARRMVQPDGEFAARVREAQAVIEVTQRLIEMRIG